MVWIEFTSLGIGCHLRLVLPVFSSVEWWVVGARCHVGTRTDGPIRRSTLSDYVKEVRNGFEVLTAVVTECSISWDIR
jgi:hypothetical protein